MFLKLNNEQIKRNIRLMGKGYRKLKAQVHARERLII